MNQLLHQYRQEIDQILARYPAGFQRSAVMPLLYLAQRQQGYVPRQAMADIAEILGISTTDVASIVGFYTLYYDQPHGRYHIQVCNDLPCAMRGADRFLAGLCDYLGISVGETTADGLFTVEAVKCLAACHRAPMFQVQGDGDIVYHEDQSLETAKAWIEDIRGGSSAAGRSSAAGSSTAVSSSAGSSSAAGSSTTAAAPYEEGHNG